MATLTHLPDHLRPSLPRGEAMGPDLRFLLLDSGDDTDAGVLGPARLRTPGDRSAIGLVDADGAPAARVDLALADGVGHWWIRVRPDLRGRGLGTRLLDLSCRHARLMGARCLHADLRAGDTRSVHLMNRLGALRTLHVDPSSRSVCLHVVVGGGCGDAGAVPALQCLCPAALRPHAPHPGSRAARECRPSAVHRGRSRP